MAKPIAVPSPEELLLEDVRLDDLELELELDLDLELELLWLLDE